VVKDIEEHCRSLPPGYPEFNHYLPVTYLLSLPESEIRTLPGIDEAIDRFGKIFSKLNTLLEV
jgi:hypothetical protein